MTNTITKITYDGDDYKVGAEYTAGTGISIDANNEISSTVSGVPTVGSNGQVLTVVSGASAWANLPSETVVSGDSGTTYTVKVANSDPTSGTPATTITFVL